MLAELALALSAAPPSDTDTGTAPLADVAAPLRAGCPVVSVTIDGRGPWPFAVDTGARVTVLDRTLVWQLDRETGLRHRIAAAGEGEVWGQEVRDVALTIGDWTSPSVSATVLDLVGFQTAPDPTGQPGQSEYLGVLGTDALAGLVLELDFPTERMRLFGSRAATGVQPIDWLPLRRGIWLALKGRVETGGRHSTGWLALDTGAAAGVILSPVFARKGLGAPLLGDTAEACARGLGGDIQLRAGRLDRLRIGGILVERVPLAVATEESGFFAMEGYDGLVGTEVWRRGRLCVDFKHPALAFEPRGR